MSRRLRVISGSGLGAPIAFGQSGFGSNSLGSNSDEAMPRGATADLAASEARGYNRGLEAGRKAAEEAYRGSIAKLEQIQESIGSQLSDAIAALEHDAVEAALRGAVEIARRILEREVAVDVNVVLGSVEGALSRLPGASDIEVRVHPLDLDHINDSGFLRDALEAGSVRFQGDASVDRGGCVVHSEAGVVDARIRTQLRRVSDEIVGVLVGPEEA